MGQNEREMRIHSVGETLNEWIIYLEELNGGRTLPVWIGASDGELLALRLSTTVLQRPLTHDLLISAVNALGATVHKVVISDLKDNTYYARLVLKKGDEALHLDARTVDAIMVAAIAACPIYVEENLLEQ